MPSFVLFVSFVVILSGDGFHLAERQQEVDLKPIETPEVSLFVSFVVILSGDDFLLAERQQEVDLRPIETTKVSHGGCCDVG